MTTEAPSRTTLVGPREKKQNGLPTSGLMLVVGHPKSGKTEFATSFPDSYTLELEKNGADRVASGRRIQDIVDEVDGQGNVLRAKLDLFGEILQLAIDEQDIKTIVIDTVDELASWIEKDIARENGVEHIQQPKAGVDSRAMWGEFRQRVEGMTNYLKESNKLVILVCHCKPPEKDDKGRVVHPAGINISGKGAYYIASQADMIGYVVKREVGGKMGCWLSFKSPSDMAIWGSRIEELDGQEIQLNRADPYGSFAAMFGTKKAAPAAPKLAPAKSTRRK